MAVFFSIFEWILMVVAAIFIFWGSCLVLDQIGNHVKNWVAFVGIILLMMLSYVAVLDLPFEDEEQDYPYQLGYEDGYESGKESARDYWIEYGTELGYEEGYNDGYKEGLSYNETEEPVSTSTTVVTPSGLIIDMSNSASATPTPDAGGSEAFREWADSRAADRSSESNG